MLGMLPGMLGNSPGVFTRSHDLQLYVNLLLSGGCGDIGDV